MTAEQAVADLVRRGAMLTPVLGAEPVPVGVMERIGPERWFWFDAGAEDEFGSHVIRADRTEVLYGGAAVEFWLENAFAGYLTTISDALEDEQAAESAEAALAAWRKVFDGSERLRGFIVRQRNARRST